MSGTVIVAAALIERGARMLLAERPPGTHLAGCWEFPGGKLEPGEPADRCLVREVREELGVAATGLAPFSFAHHRYPERDVLILLFRCDIDGEPRALHARALGWFTVEEARRLRLPEADLPLLDEIARRRGA